MVSPEISMKKRSPFTTTAVFAVFVIGIAVYTYFFQFKKSQETEKKKAEEAIVLQTKKTDLNRIEIVRQSGPVILEKRAPHQSWYLVQPLQDLADQDSVSVWLDSMFNEKSQETVIEGEGINLSTFGLDQPVTGLKLSSGTTQLELKIGSVKSFDGQLYAQIVGQSRVLLVGSSWDLHLSKPVFDLRHKALFRPRGDPLGPDNTKVSQLRLRVQGQPALELKKDGESWNLMSGGDKTWPLSANRVNQFIDRVKSVKATEFVDEDRGRSAAKYGLNGDVAARVELQIDGETRPYFLEIGSKIPPDANTRFAGSSDLNLVAKINKSFVDEVSVGASQFYNPQYPFTLSQKDVREVILKTKDQTLHLKRENDAASWALLGSAPADKDFNPDQVNRLLDQVSLLEASRIDEKRKPEGLRSGENTALFRGPDGRELLGLQWGMPYERIEKGGAAMGETPRVSMVDLKTTRVAQTITVNETDLSEFKPDRFFRAKAQPANPAK